MLTYNEISNHLNNLSGSRSDILNGKLCLNTENGLIPFKGVVRYTSPENIKSMYVISAEKDEHVMVKEQDTIILLP